MTTFIEFLIKKMQEKAMKRYDGVPLDSMTIVDGVYYSTLTGGDPPTVEVDWPKLQAEIEQLEEEFKKGQT